MRLDRIAIVEIKFIKQSFYHTFPVIPKAQNYRKCMEKRNSNIKEFQRKIPSPNLLSCEHELISLVNEGDSLEK